MRPVDELREHYDNTDTSEELAGAEEMGPSADASLDLAIAALVHLAQRYNALQKRTEELAEHLDVLADAWGPRPGIGLGACERDQRQMVSDTYRYNALLVRGLLDG